MGDLSGLDDLALRFAINLTAMAILLFGLFYHRHGDRKLVTTAAIFNVFAFAVLGKLASAEFGLAAGFGLFAILALFSLRSVQIGRIEISYFFGSIAIAVICSIPSSPPIYSVVISSVVLLAVYFIDHPKLLRSSNVLRVTLDKIDADVLSDSDGLKKIASRRLGVEVLKLEIVTLNLIKQQAIVDLSYIFPEKSLAMPRQTIGPFPTPER